MVTQSVDETPVTSWRLDTPSARQLAAEVARLEDLQTVLQCCERLLGELAGGGPGQPGVDAVVGSLWATALAAYQRCFVAGDEKKKGGQPLTEKDVVETHPDQPEAADWHRALIALTAPGGATERPPDSAYTVGAVRGDDGAPLGIAVSSPARLLPDELVVRSAGTITYALSVVVEARVVEHQVALFEEVARLSQADLDQLPQMEAAPHR